MNTAGPPWADEIDVFLAKVRANLRVLVWGPGETNRQEWFRKRREVIEAIKASGTVQDEVFTSEDLARLHSPSPMEPGVTELLHAETADIIIALVMASPSSQGGIYRELEIIAPYRELRNKVLIFLPMNKSWAERFAAGALREYKEHQKIPLNWATLKNCERLREMCIAKVEEERKERMGDKLRAYLHARGHASQL